MLILTKPFLFPIEMSVILHGSEEIYWGNIHGTDCTPNLCSWLHAKLAFTFISAWQVVLLGGCFCDSVICLWQNQSTCFIHKLGVYFLSIQATVYAFCLVSVSANIHWAVKYETGAFSDLSLRGHTLAQLVPTGRRPLHTSTTPAVAFRQRVQRIRALRHCLTQRSQFQCSNNNNLNIYGPVMIAKQATFLFAWVLLGYG